ncbi:hypothetical protein HYPSUDRAFT_148428 [Hypholoma sublateritium FD-334 SS-4]|uniref:tyrosinase n=1 Tax=Hypholoma sublateritium (strain FD-334 SS-4) TaxID=945553 RepID=A0A0D2P6I0_HYPSF|nr:hypothetical protein HYPSUDRAFT_148428 [Hypholoma sublateritium FD-334 SS-4]
MSPYSGSQSNATAGAPSAPAGAPSAPASGTAPSNSGAHSLEPAGAPGKQEDAHYLVTGVPGNPCNRIEIHDFVKNEKFFSLYVQALNMINQYSRDNVESFFQIGGIHGRPHEAWSGATASDNAGKYLGYCTHGSTLFPTWHRPYVMLLEQVLQKRAVEIANTYKVNTAAWKEAARTIRFPYWDWAIHATPPSEVISSNRVTITDMNGTKRQVDNPFYSFVFPPNEINDFEGNYRVWPTTLRRPMSTDAGAQSNVPELINVLNAAVEDVQENTYTMLTRVTSWEKFSNTQLDDNPVTSTSLEGIHNGTHYRVGATSVPGLSGHMGNNDVAAFDPIFFLHHANVDRMISLWSALHPGVWVAPGDSADGTATIAENTLIDTKTPLSPFWKTKTSFWTSAEVGNTQSLGYSYPEFDGLDLKNAVAVKAAIAAKVNMLYGASGTYGAIPQIPGAPQVPTPAPSTKCPAHGKWDWTARIRVKKFEVGCSFQIVLFLGTVPSDPKQWNLSPRVAGTYCILVNESVSNCANCASQSEFVEQGYIPLNRGISKLSGLSSLDPAGVVAYLTANLYWKAQKVDGTPADTPSLEVTVFCTPLSYPAGATAPVGGTPVGYPSCTSGRLQPAGR